MSGNDERLNKEEIEDKRIKEMIENLSRDDRTFTMGDFHVGHSHDRWQYRPDTALDRRRAMEQQIRTDLELNSWLAREYKKLSYTWILLFLVGAVSALLLIFSSLLGDYTSFFSLILSVLGMYSVYQYMECRTIQGRCEGRVEQILETHRRTIDYVR